MRIFVIGTRGFPDIQGGVEQHCEKLYPLIASSICQITVFRRKPYLVDIKNNQFEFIRFIDLPSTRIPGLEALYHTFLCSVTSIFKRPDIVHVHNIGPGFFVPFLKIAGLKVVMTYHSPNYEHIKWSAFTRYFLKFSELISTRFSDKVIFVSLYQKNKFRKANKFVHINNGVKHFPLAENDDYIKTLGLQKKKYILAVGRLVEEKGFDLLIHSFSRIKETGVSLVIAGDSDHETAYSTRLRGLAKTNHVIMPGFVKGEELRQLYSHAKLFVISSYNEGQPLSLLEAMSYHLPVLASDIPANLQISLPDECYFKSDDEDSLAGQLDRRLSTVTERVDYDMTKYDWSHIAEQTRTVYEEILGMKN